MNIFSFTAHFGSEDCGTVGYMSGLIRLQSGLFEIGQAFTLDEIKEKKDQCLLDVLYPLKDVENFIFEDRFFDDIDHGRPVLCPFEEGYRKIYCNNVFFGLGRNSNGKLKLEYYLKNA